MSQKSFYPHMIVGNVTKYNKDAIVTVESQDFELYDELKTLIESTEFINATDKLSLIKNRAVDFLTGYDSRINTTDELFALYPAFNKMTTMLAATKADDITMPVGEELNFIDTEVIWNNFIAQYIINENKDLIYNLQLAVKLGKLLENVSNGSFNKVQQVFDFWKNAKVILPKPIFPLPPKVMGKKDPGYYDFENVSTVEPVNYQPIIDSINELKAARKDILANYDAQHYALDRKISETDYKNAIVSNFKSAEEGIIEDFKIGKKETVEDIKSEFDETFKQAQYKNYLDQSAPVESFKKKKYEEYQELSKPDNIEAFAQEKYAEYQAQPKALHEELPTVSFSDATKSTLSEHNLLSDTVNLDFAIKRIDSLIHDKSNELSKFVSTEKVVRIGNSLLSLSSVYEDAFCNTNDTPKSHCELIQDLIKTDPTKAVVQVLGMGYANIIKQEIVRYEADEIADIENIFQGEEKTKTYRNLKRQEDYASTEKESNEETSTDNKTSERFELAREVNKLSTSADQLQAGTSISSSFGPTSLSANVGYATQNASSEAAATAVNNAKEITQQATHNIQERILEKRSSLSINEVEITNEHTIDNIGADSKHINGFYYWVDKVYSNQVYNLGKRLMLEFLIPEPAAHYVYSQAFSKKDGITIDKPVHPKDFTGGTMPSNKLNSKTVIALPPIKSHRDISIDNYHIWAAIYNAPDINPPPPQSITISKAFDSTSGSGGFSKSESIVIKDGYCAKNAYLSDYSGTGSKTGTMQVIIGKTLCGLALNSANFNLDEETGTIPLSFVTYDTCSILNIEIYCKLTPSGLEKWQIETYNAIINAYNKQKAEYDNAVAAMEDGNNIQGQNPITNRKVEKMELKKWGIEMLTLQRFCGFNAMKRASDQSPEMSFDEAKNEAPFVKFIEQAIDWNNMTYLYYPYFWSDKKRWNIIKNFNDNDPAFADFLQAGYARVVVPVQTQFTEAVLYYLQSGQIWMGEDMPVIGDELYLSIIDEIKSRDGNQEETPIGDPWETRIPTNFVMLTDIIPAELPGYTV